MYGMRAANCRTSRIGSSIAVANKNVTLAMIKKIVLVGDYRGKKGLPGTIYE
jgi:hypothetical protein